MRSRSILLRMLTTALLIVQASVFVSLPVHAQQEPPTVPPGVMLQPVPSLDPSTQRLYDSGVRLRRIGRPLTITGAVLVPVGIALLIGGTLACTHSVIGPGYLGYPGYGYSGCAAGVGLDAIGAIFEVAGWPALGGGIALWVIGNHRIDQARSKPPEVHDGDGDGFPDNVDKCPTLPGPYQGCPHVYVDQDKIRIAEQVHFATDQDVILPESVSLLVEVAGLIKVHPEWEKILVEGHCDSRASDAHNLDLSQRRAESVLRFLVSQGVQPSHLNAQGFGRSRPIADNTTEEGMAQNRRVEFTLLKVTP